MILVTGGNGFIGRYVCPTLSTHGKNVISLDRKGQNRPVDKTPYPTIECDIRGKDQVEQIFRQHSFTAIVHLASLLNTASQKSPLEATQINVMGSLHILEAARKFGVPKVIYGSSISVYGSKPVESQDGILETEPAAPGDIYGVAKRYVEIVGDAYRQQFGIQFIALRISSVVGPGAMNTASPWRSEIFEKLGLPHRVEVAIPYGDDEALPLVYVEDVADMVKRLVETEQTSFAIYNAPSETWKLSELAAYIESLDNNLRITFGQSTVHGIPRVINGQRFVTEFRYLPTLLKERLRRAAQLRTGQNAQ